MITTIWMCRNAIYHEDDYVKCSKGHNLGVIHARMVKKGNPLVCLTCQGCKDCDIMGKDIPKDERGWL
jgi:hypothetical protein